MYLSEISAELNIPVRVLISFLDSRGISVDINTNLSIEEHEVIIKNIDEVRAKITLSNIDSIKLEGPKVIKKIDLSAIDASTRPKRGALGKELTIANKNISGSTNRFPRLLAAAKEFDVGADVIVEYLVKEGFDRSELKPTSRLTENMYLLVKAQFSRNNNKRPSIILGKGLVCLNVGADTFIEMLKVNNVSYDFKSVVYEMDSWSIVLSQKELKSLFDSDFLLSSTKGLSKIKTIKKNGIEEVLTVDLFSFLEWENKQVELFESGYYSSIFLHPIRLLDFASVYKLDSHELRQKLKNLGYNFLSDRWNLSQKVPLDLFEKFLQIENKPFEPFFECVMSQEQKILSDKLSNSTDLIAEENSINLTLPINKTNMHFQKILFGSPGTGKSHTIDGAGNSYLKQLNIINKSFDCVKTVFHPEYTYGDFMGKLMPFTNDDGAVEYRFYAGHFLKALGRAYKNIILAKIEHEKDKEEIEKVYKREINKTNKREFTELEVEELQKRKDEVRAPIPQNVALVIDEINRGNSSAIFGTIFQLLDRDSKGWSSYHVRISDLENNKLMEEISLEYKEYKKGSRIEKVSYGFDDNECSEADYKKYLDYIFQDLPENEQVDLTKRDIKLPPNLSIIATMNTSDNSIYFMDSAFKRRWDWEFIDITSNEQKQMQSGRRLEDGFPWDEFVDSLNSFIKKYGERIRKIEDKQIGYYFIKGDVIRHEAIKNKLMFFLWDSIFNNDKKPLKELIGMDISLVTFGDFIRNYDLFISAIKNKTFLSSNVL